MLAHNDVSISACELDHSPESATALCGPQLQVAPGSCLRGKVTANVTGEPEGTEGGWG